MELYDDNEIYDNKSNEMENEGVDEYEELRYESMVEIAHSRHDDNKIRMKYMVLSLNDIHERQHNATKSVSTLLVISKAEAATLLRHFDWNSINANKQWFASEEKVRNGVVLLLQPDDSRINAREGCA